MGQGASGAEVLGVEEVAPAVQLLRNGAAPGADGLTAPKLKPGPTMLSWLHRVIAAVCVSGHASVEWKRAMLVALYRGKGDILSYI